MLLFLMMMIDLFMFDVCLGVLIFYLLIIVFVIWQDGYTPLYWAAGGGHLSALQLLLLAHADVYQANRVSESKVSNLHHSLVELLFILWFYHGDGDDDCKCDCKLVS